MILRYDQGMNTHPETPRPMPGRDLKTLTAEELLALPAYVLKRFEDLARANDQAEIKEVFEDFIAFAPDLARAVIELTAERDAYREENTRFREQAARVKALADRLDAAAADDFDGVSGTSVSLVKYETAKAIRTALNGDDR